MLITKKLNYKFIALLELVRKVRAGVTVQQGNLELKARQAPTRRHKMNRLSKAEQGENTPSGRRNFASIFDKVLKA